MPTPLLNPPTADFVQKTLAGALNAGSTASATLNNTTSIPNSRGIAIIDRVNSNGVETPNQVEVLKYTGTSGATLTTLTRGLAGTSDQDHAVSAIVEFGPDILWAQAIIDGLSQVLVPSTGALDTTKVVDLTTAQALTNKDLSDASNTLPTTAVTLTGTQTLTNKRITPRITTIVSNAQPTVNTDSCDLVTITAIGTDITSMSANLSGTPTNGQKLIYRIKDDGTSRAITWGASFASRGGTLPTATTLGKVHHVGFLYNTVTSTFDCVAAIVEA